MLAVCLAGLALIRVLHAATRVSQAPQPHLPDDRCRTHEGDGPARKQPTRSPQTGGPAKWTSNTETPGSAAARSIVPMTAIAESSPGRPPHVLSLVMR